MAQMLFQGKGLWGLLGQAGDKKDTWLRSVPFYFPQSKAGFAQFSSFVYSKREMNSRPPEGYDQEDRQASELCLAGTSGGPSLSTSGQGARSAVSSSKFRAHA